MGNQLFQQAKVHVKQFMHANDPAEKQEKLEVAKNSLSSAYANSTPAEQTQLREFQQQLEDGNLR